MPAEAEVFNSPGATALKRMREKDGKTLGEKTERGIEGGLDGRHVAIILGRHTGGGD